MIALTGQRQRGDAFRIDYWKQAGLLKPTWLKPVIGTLSTRIVLRRLGKLSPPDRDRVKKVVKKLIAGEFLP